MRESALSTYMVEFNASIRCRFFPLYFKELCQGLGEASPYFEFLQFMKGKISGLKCDFTGISEEVVKIYEGRQRIHLNRFRRNFSALDSNGPTKALMEGLRPYLGLTDSGYIPSSKSMYAPTQASLLERTRSSSGWFFKGKSPIYDYKHATIKFLDHMTRNEGAALTVEVNFFPDIVDENTARYVDICRCETTALDELYPGMGNLGVRTVSKAFQWVKYLEFV